MRTTLSLEPDVTSLLEALRRNRKLSLKAAVNAALREGLTRLAAPSNPTKPFATRTVDLGNCRINRVDDIAEALALAEGDNFK